MDPKASSQVSQYMERHEIFKLFEELLQQLILHKPNEPLDFLIDYLEKPHGKFFIFITSGPKIILISPPWGGKEEQKDFIVREFGVVPLSVYNLVAHAASSDSKFKEQAGEYTNKELSNIPEEFLIELLKEEITKEECKHKGWLLDDFPFTRRQVRLELCSDETLGFGPSVFRNPPGQCYSY